MKGLLISLVSVICICSCSPEGNIPYDLRCENLSSPLGVNTDKPRLSWKNKFAGNGDRQTAYHILAASSPALLAAGKADVWDSELTASEESVLRPLAGRKLSSGEVVYWKVRTYDKNGKASLWSETAHFSIGLLTASDRQGDYIGFPTADGDPQSPLLRKQFELAAKPERAFVHVNSLGYHEVYLNGKKVSDEPLAPAMAQFDKRSLSRTYDVSQLILKGNNDLVVWLGRGWYQFGMPGVVYEGPLLKAQIDVWNNGERSVAVATDGSWQACEKGGYTLTSKSWRYHNFGGERVDANALPKNFSADELNSRQWVKAATVSVPEHTVSAQSTEENFIAETYNAVNVKQLSDSLWLIDFGKTLTGWVEIKFPQLHKNQEITLHYSDHLNDKGLFDDREQIDYYIASGAKNEVFTNKFNYHSFRYLQIAGLEHEPGLESMKAMLIRTAYKDASSFACSDGDLNAIHDLVQHTLHCLSLSGYLVDCHHIERLGYGGDGHASTLTAQTLFDLAPLYSNWLQAWEDCIQPDGGLPHTAPNPYPAGGGPYWCAFIVTAPWGVYQSYGDLSTLERYYPVMKHWLQYVDTYTVDGLLKSWPDTDYRGWYLGDWATPKGINQQAPASVDLVDNCVISECYTILEKIATLLGKRDEAAEFASRKTAINSLIHSTYYLADNSTYGTGTQIDLAYPMLVGVTPENLIAETTESLLDITAEKYNGHLSTGLVGIPVLVDWAVKNNQPDFVYSMLKKRGYPGYLYMLDNGATATWEHWNGERSHIHNCYNGIGAWFYQAIGGIRPDETAPGYRRFVIDPQIPTALTWAKTTKETPYGTIAVSWEKTDNGLLFDITVPTGSAATMPLPKNAKSYTLNGQSLDLPIDGVITLESGNHLLSTSF
ncbi:MAG: glycoside hydrolase family 78 protein [Tannerella sp.]|jgi:alpha-L-rhamnosidase|nr:glycoside hydrolase family 78 protein [Tannerella sp.]